MPRRKQIDNTVNNRDIADKLREIADLLEQQGANPFRSNAYRRAAETVVRLKQPLVKLMTEQGLPGLVALPGIGAGIARSLVEYVKTGRMSRLESLKAGHDPIETFEQIPGIGPTLAHRLIEVLHIDTLEALEIAAHNRRLSQVPGFSEKKIEMVQAWLNHVLGYRRMSSRKTEAIVEPPVALLLQVDSLYRSKAAKDELPKIAPKRFNPSGEAWLPIMHLTRKGWHFTALYSNTSRAHRLKKTDDWVVLFYYDNEHHEGQHTVVTENKPPLRGKRVVRGRERECQDYYAARQDG